MKRRSVLFALWVGVAGCADDEPEDASSTAATTVENTSGMPSTSDPGTSTEGADSSSGGDDSSSSGEVLLDVIYEDDVQPLWNANCTCHLMGSSGTMTATVLTLNPDISYGELVGVPSEQSDLARVVVDDLEASYLWHKVSQTHADIGEGTEMPPGNPLDDEQLLVIRSWILSGAQP